VPETERETNATWSTYRVIAAIAKVEIFGRFDALNAWDGAFISVGLYHWTLGVGSSRGEIGALFALLHERDPAAFEAALGRYGVRPERAWNSDGEGLHEGTQYVSHLSLRGTDGQWTPIETRAAKTWFRCWSWFYRMQMACRCVEGLRRVMWDLGRLRIRDVLDRIVVDERPLRDLFTSERTVAMLIRWHVNAPGTLRASRLAAILPEGEPSKWDEQALADGIMRAIESIPVTDKFKQGAKDTLVSSTEKVRDDEDLRTAMGSFSFDESGL